MARTDTLEHYLTDIADAIRTKTGESGPISASSFDTNIGSIPSGGGFSVGIATTSVPNGTTDYEKDITFSNILGQPKMYVFLADVMSSSKYYLTLYNLTLSQYWDGTSNTATSIALKETSASSATQVYIERFSSGAEATPGTYDSTNQTFTVHRVAVPTQNSTSNNNNFLLIYVY